jgi:hypothetical protein
LGGKYLIDEVAIHHVISLPMHDEETEKDLTAKYSTPQEIYGTYDARHGR